MAGNSSLGAAKQAKKDEFYTFNLKFPFSFVYAYPHYTTLRHALIQNFPSAASGRCSALWWSTPVIASTCHESGPRRADSHSSRPARPTHRGAEALATASVLWWAAGSRSPVLCLARAPAPTSSGRCGPITRRVMGMEGSRSAGPIGLAHPRSRGRRRRSSGPSQHADASQAV